MAICGAVLRMHDASGDSKCHSVPDKTTRTGGGPLTSPFELWTFRHLLMVLESRSRKKARKHFLLASWTQDLRRSAHSLSLHRLCCFVERIRPWAQGECRAQFGFQYVPGKQLPTWLVIVQVTRPFRFQSLPRSSASRPHLPTGLCTCLAPESMLKYRSLLTKTVFEFLRKVADVWSSQRLLQSTTQCLLNTR